MELQTVIFYGKPGSGKGTHAKLLKQYLEKEDPTHPVLYIETGAVFREFATQDNFTARLVKEMLARGGLLPAFLPVWIWTDFFIKNITEGQHIILDGLARRDDEVPVLARALEFYKRSRTQVVEMRISDEEAKTRLKIRGRADDTDTEIARRLEWYSENVIPAIEAWKSFPEVAVQTIDGEHTIEEVQIEVRKKLNLS